MGTDFINLIWPEWNLVRQIGSGSYGDVYEAVRFDYAGESHAAVKIISIPKNSAELDALRSEGLSEDEIISYLKEILQTFIKEIQIMEAFKGCQNIVCIEDYKVLEKSEQIGWDICIRMELLKPLNAYLHENVMSEREVIRLGCDICSALERCAIKKVIHRDIKPANIFINEYGDFKLGDFGIARKLENITMGMSHKGTYSYMAPEVEKGSQYDATVDIYSLGIVLYHLVNRMRPPFLKKDIINPRPYDFQIANRRRLNGEPLPAPCDASPKLARVILRACSYDPKMRYSSATEMKNALLAVADATTSVSRYNPINSSITDTHTIPLGYSSRKTVENVSEGSSSVKKTSKRISHAAVILIVSLLIVGSLLTVYMVYNKKKEFASLYKDTILMINDEYWGYSRESLKKVFGNNYDSGLTKWEYSDKPLKYVDVNYHGIGMALYFQNDLLVAVSLSSESDLIVNERLLTALEKRRELAEEKYNKYSMALYKQATQQNIAYLWERNNPQYAMFISCYNQTNHIAQLYTSPLYSGKYVNIEINY